MTPDPQRVAEVVRKHILTAYRVDSCIVSTRVVIDVLAYFGQTARPWPVRAVAWNALAASFAADGVKVDQWPDAAYGIAIASAGDHKPGVFDGHLVALAGARITPAAPDWSATHLYDASLDQMSRPAHGIRLAPAAVELPPGWNGQEAVLELRGGGLLTYQGIADDSWRRSPNWRDTPLNRRLAGAAIRELRGEPGS